MGTLVKTIADFSTTLTSKVIIGDVTATLTSVVDADGATIANGTYGFTIDRNNNQKEHITCTLTGTALTNIKSCTVAGGVESTGFKKEHRKGAEVIISDFVAIKRIQDVLETGYGNVVVPTADYQLATKKYVDDIALGGTTTVDKMAITAIAGETVAAGQLVYLKAADGRWWLTDADTASTVENVILGIAQGAGTAGNVITGGVIITGIDSNQTGLTPNTVYYASNTAGGISTTAGTKEVTVGLALTSTTLQFYPKYNQSLTEDEQDALVGSQGVVSSTNKYITSDNVFTADYDQSQTTQNGTVEVGEADSTTKKNDLAQSFIPTKTKIRGVKLYKSADTVAFTGTVTVSLQADTAGSPSGTALATVTISNLNYLQLPVGEFTATFTSEYASLVQGSIYWIVIQTSTADTSNHPNLGTNTAGGYTNGSMKYWNTTDGWVAINTWDLYFKTLQGDDSQVIQSDTTGKLPTQFYDVTKMPKLAFAQHLALDVYDQLNAVEFGSGSNQDGSVFFVQVQGGSSLYRFEIDVITGQYLQTHAVTTTPAPISDADSGIIVIGDYVYKFFGANGTGKVACNRYLAADLTGETVMTVPDLPTSNVMAWTDGEFAYVVLANTPTTSRKWSVSGTTFTAVSTATVTTGIYAGTSGCSMFDGVTSYCSKNAAGTPIDIIKNTTITGATREITTKIFPLLSDVIIGTFLINIDETRMYFGAMYATYDETAAISSNIMLYPITKP